VNDCSNNGDCVEEACVCHPGYSGIDCSDNSDTCPDRCSGNGECVEGACMCYPGYKGDNCALKTKFCPKGCSGRGRCMNSGLCSCFDGWTGLECGDRFDTATRTTNNTLVQQSLSDNDLGEGTEQSVSELPARLPRK
jgi:hypothetical protein